MKKLLLVASFPDTIIRFRGELIKSLLANGVQVQVTAPNLDIGSPMRLELEAMGAEAYDIPLRRTGINPAADATLLWHLVVLMRKQRPHLVLAYQIKAVIYGSLAASLTGVPSRFALITGLGYSLTGGRRAWLRWLVERLYGLALRRVTVVFFQNADDEQLFFARGILSPKARSMVVSGSGVDVTEFAVAPLPTKPIRFLMISRLLVNKGVREYVQAARKVRETSINARFYLAGYIDDNPDSISMSELDSWIAEGIIEFLGRLGDVRSAIADSSVYVLPSYGEGMPRTVLEAMAMGRAIITTDAPGCRETVVSGVNGFIVPRRSIDGLVRAMIQLMHNPALVQSMGLRSREMAEEKFDVRKVNRKMLDEMGITQRS